MDRDRLRWVANTRPGYATWPDTRPGSPHWQRTRQPGPCTWVLRHGAGLLCIRSDHQHCAPAGTVLLAAQPAPAPRPVAAAAPPARRRWWHRITRQIAP